MIDLRTIDFAAFVTLAFDHPAYEGQEVEVDGHRIVRVIEERPAEWYWDVDWAWDELPNDPLHTLALMTELFERAGELRGRFTPRQIDQGFRLLLGPAAADPFVAPLWDATLPWGPRERFLRSTFALYERLFDVELAIDFVPFMFWDSLFGYRYEDPALAFPPSADDARIQRVAVDVIRALLLDLNGPWSAPAGLHGAHHVHHPDALDAVRAWLADPANDDEFYRKYARRVLVGDAM